MDFLSGSTNANINGLIDQNNAPNTTWNLSDTVSSTGGTVNLNVITAGAALAGYNTSGVTTLKVKPIDAANTATSSSFDVGSMTGLTKVSVGNASVIGSTADTFTINSAPAAASVELISNGSTQNVTANFASAATAGAADTVNVSVTGRTGTFLVGTGFETLALTGGAAGRVAAANSETTASIKTVTVSGVDMRVDAALDSTVTSIDASTATGTVNLAAAPGSAFSAKGGAGTSDILAVSTLTSTHTVTGFETLVATAAATYDLTGATATNLGVGVQAGAVSFTNAAATQNNIVLGGLQQRTTAVAATGSLATNGTIGYALKTATGASDTLNIAVNNGGTATTGTFTTGAITATAIENIAISAANWTAVVFGGLTLSTTTTAASNVTVAATAANMTFGTIGLTQGTTTLGAANVINFGAVTGTTSATVGTVASVTFTGGTGVDTTTIGVTAAGATSTYNMGTGNDVVTVGANNAADATSITNINGEAGDDLIDITGTFATAPVLNIDGGTGADTVRINAASSFIDSLVGVEKLVNINGTTTTIAASSTALNNSLEITQIGAATTAFTTTVGQIVSIAGVTAIGTVDATTLTLTGSTGAETLTGSSTVGTAILGGAGADTITGGAGADVITGGAGADTINAGLGIDSFVFTEANGAATAAGDLAAGASNDLISGIVATETIVFGAAAGNFETSLIIAGGVAGAGGNVANMANATTFTNGAVGALEYWDNGTNVEIRISTAASTAYTAAADIVITLVGVGTGVGNAHVMSVANTGILTFTS